MIHYVKELNLLILKVSLIAILYRAWKITCDRR